jgi:WD40 repeat protein/tRNA A-37 threonylcarbamoyl transferase component Bud32
MGVVYKARQSRLNRIVALKLILSGQHASKQEILRFRAEAESAASLRHPNIVAIYETGEEDGRQFFSMEFVQGRDLAAVARDGALRPRLAADYARKIAEAIDYAHGRGILHRDLKPSNVLIDCDGEPRVTDFGLAKRLPENRAQISAGAPTGSVSVEHLHPSALDSGLTLTGQVLGSPNFMPPEQTSTKTPLTPASDVYGIGALLYHLLTACPPFQAGTIEEVLRALHERDPVSPRLLNPSVPRDLETICLKCLEKNPARRYATARELAEELRRFLNGETVRARPTGAQEKLLRWCRRKPLVAGLLSALLLATMLGGTGILWQWTRARQSAADRLVALRETHRQLYAADMKAAQQAWLMGNGFLLGTLLENHRPKSGEEDLRGFEWRYLTRLLQQDDRAVFYPEPSSVGSLSFSANERLLVTVLRSRVAHLWRIGGKVEPKPIAEFTNVTSAALSPTGSLLALAQTGGKIILQDTSAGPQTGSFESGIETVSLLAFTPDGTELAVSKDEAIRFFALSDGRETSHVEHEPGMTSMAISPDGRFLAALSKSGSALIWNLRTQQKQSGFAAGTNSTMRAIAFSPDSETVATCAEDGVNLWNAATGKLIYTFPHVRSTLNSAAFSPGGKFLTAAGWGGCHLWNLETKEDLQESHFNKNMVSSLTFSHDGKFLALGAEDGVWLRNLQPKIPYESVSFGQEVRSLAFAPDNQTLAIGGRNHFELYELDSRRSGAAQDEDAQGIDFSPDGKMIATGGDDSVVRFWDAADLKSIKRLDLDSWSRTIAFSPDGRWLAASVTDQANGVVNLPFKLWNCHTWQEIESPIEFRGGARSLCFAHDSSALAIASADGIVAVLDSRTWQQTSRHDLHQRSAAGWLRLLHGSVFLHDNRTLVTGDNAGRVIVWDTKKQRLLHSWQAHSAGIRAMALSPDGRSLATGGYDHSVTLWHTATWRAMLTLEHPATVYAIAFSHNGGILATGCEDGLARLWRAPVTP